ncbi:hypothetical protein [Desulfovibrio sp. JC022]|uniref:hypothetical protein n=1 Tax=Desulfovibrio sp. JC022 TaxID=2593642 RepID=UPI0013D2E1B2|nr:hypothetical protein [Desulfovibrio sp. JC022]NDV21902.1 hypothetical protein [Desulfovibrio sp. JC022]
MKFAIGLVVLICYTVGLIVYFGRSDRTIFCLNCGHEFVVRPNKSQAYLYLLGAMGVAIGNVVIGLGGFSISILLAIAGCYYLFKEEGYKCYNCKTINQLP